MLRRSFLFLLLFGCSLAMAAEPTTGFLDKTHKNEDGTESKYVVFVPHDYDGAKEYPIILFLHGSVESYYYKQLAQEVVRNICRSLQVVNEIDVD